MNNTINVNGMTSYYSSFVKSVTPKTNVGKAGANGVISKIEKAELSEEEKLEVFKKEIWKELDSLPWNNSVNVSIKITESAFKRMMTDTDFKNRMMDKMREEASACKSPIVSSITMIDENGYRGITYNDYNMADTAFRAHSKSKDSFYVKRAANKSIQDQLYKKAAEKKKLEEKRLQEAAEKRQAYTDFLNEKISHKTNSISESNDFFQMPSDTKVAEILSEYEAGTFADRGLI